MGFLRRLLGGDNQPAAPSWPPRGPITAWPSGQGLHGALPVITFDAPPNGAKVEVVGESNYQGSLQVLAGGYDANGPRVRDHKAVLLPEPDNPYDPNAVRVVVVATSGHWGRSATFRAAMPWPIGK